MVLPTPVVPIVDACSTLFNNTLYSYSSDAFQSLPLVQGGVWSELPMGVEVTGGVCVKSTPTNDTSPTALYIVGGTANTSDYQGLQRFVFETGKWETVSPSVPVTQNRLYHNAVYLNASDSILVYAGTQDGTKSPSSQTFTIQTSEPYNVLAFEAEARPAMHPLLMQWTESEAVYIGGSVDNTEVMVFSPSQSWVNTNITLAVPIYNTTAIKAVVVNGDDGSRNLYTFDMSVSPNVVNRTVLVGADGLPIANAAPVVRRAFDKELFEEPAAKRVKRSNLTVADWPAYNNTLAPTSTRSTYSMAMDQSKQVVISGGSTRDVLCIFKARDNSWANATEELVSDATTTVNGLSTQASASATSTEAASTTSAAAAAESSSAAAAAFPVKVLGAVLGTIAGIAFLLLAILFLFRRRKEKRQHDEAGHQRRASGISNDEKNDMVMDYPEKSSFPQSPPARYGHNQNESQGSFSSVAMLMGRIGHNRGTSKGVGSIASRTSSQFNKNYKTAISNPIPQDQYVASVEPVSREEKGVSFARERSVRKPRGSTNGNARRGSTRRSSGWNKYWSGGSALNIFGFGSKRTTYEGSDRDSDISQYTDDRRPSVTTTQISAMPPPLQIPAQPGLYRVASGSPRLETSPDQFPFKEGMAGQIDHHDNRSSTSSYPDGSNAYATGIRESHHTTWSQVGRQDFGRHDPADRVQSDAYTESVYGATLPPGTGSPFPQEARFQAPPPRPGRQPQQSSDMSWLNLGTGGRI